MAQKKSFESLISISKDLDELLNQSNSIAKGARTFFRSKTNTSNFLKHIGELVPETFGYLGPGENLPDLKKGHYICKPEVGWGNIGVFDLEVTNDQVRSRKLKKKASSIRQFFANHRVNTKYRIEEHIVDESTESYELGVTDFKLHCFQGLESPITLVKNRTTHYTIWVDKEMNIIHTGKHNNLPKHLYNGFLESKFIKFCSGMNWMINKSPISHRGIDTYRYLNKFIDKSRKHPLDEFHEFKKDTFFRVAQHANELMSKIPLTYCRIDLYNSNKGIVAGELTPIPGGIYRFYPEIDTILGVHYVKAQKIFKERFNEGHFKKALEFLNHRMLIE